MFEVGECNKRCKMANLSEVRHALKQGDKSKAASLLKIVLKQNQTAEAWYLAAKLATKDDTRLKYLRQAIRLDPGHLGAQEMLGELKHDGSGMGLMGGIVEELQSFGENNRWLGRLSPQQRMYSALGIFGLIIVVFAGLIFINLRPDEPATVYIPPSSRPDPIFAEQFAELLARHDITLASFEALELTEAERNIENPTLPVVLNAKYSAVITHADTTSQMTVYFYDSDRSAWGDQRRIANLLTDEEHNAFFAGNLALVYPNTSDNSVAQLIFRS